VSARYLLDTNIVSDLVRHPQGRAAAKIAEVGEEAVATSIIVAAELRYGAAKKASPRLTAQLEAVLGVLEIIALELPADASYGAARVALEAAGTPIGANDLLIAAQALARDMIVVTDNEREFARVDGLRHENWLRSSTAQTQVRLSLPMPPERMTPRGVSNTRCKPRTQSARRH
jgi:tRNA(fMet)-specific endonuclease VapC